MKSTHGFTLLESLLFVSVASIILLATAASIVSLEAARIKQRVSAEVEQTGILAMNRITQAIRNADSISAPSANTAAQSLTLAMLDPAKNPTIFDISSGILRIKEGSSTVVPLTSPSVQVSNMSFNNLTSPSTPGTLRIQFLLAAVNASQRYEYSYEKTFIGSASLR